MIKKEVIVLLITNIRQYSDISRITVGLLTDVYALAKVGFIYDSKAQIAVLSVPDVTIGSDNFKYATYHELLEKLLYTALKLNNYDKNIDIISYKALNDEEEVEFLQSFDIKIDLKKWKQMIERMSLLNSSRFVGY